ncbi:MAG: cation diffusion facilitator family transporter [Candidatus Woesearchaeota archaeon]|jgi:cation diffusion facilitator family transporter|nr:cation diffusion facilitator family transporter [Candidatus Woesearchaeota archaeon]MDP6265170.1 cation diffusion facilitator family transporter [Candidatus Woesearchaeota archaeon]MDP6600647.1 cation diffusion facilitator family transporter [Candidatus Woesearchaeota archaeon]MDP7322989.1 cation diffusion facilitator family transporter [Candidatus Woesearchaeota archaeon]MDP7476737.1 cation diffusion facilitator family transporter [Candidatus Woesearchaeota archaeon]|tara:strand:+ start:2720 stop:3589 length:870 start_codon:yes stop_codon:yes gene_type:complete
MKITKKSAVTVGILGNILLFISKLIIGFLTNSIAIISDALNSLTDIINSIVLFVSVKVGSKSPDKEHPFGHYRSEPIGALIVAVLTIVLGFEVVRIAIDRLINKVTPIFSIHMLLILLITIAVKASMYFYTKAAWKKTKSTALGAFMVDHRNDILIASGAIIGFIGSNYNLAFLDPLVAIFIGLWIIKVGFGIGISNIKFLMGESPKKELLEKIKNVALKVEGVRSIQEVKAHYVGTLVQVELHIMVDRDLTIYRAHTIGRKVEKKVHMLEDVEKAFVHIDPIIKSRPH